MILNDIYLRLCDIDRTAQTILADAGYDHETGTGCKLCTDSSDPEARFFREALENLLILLGDLHEGLDYLKTPTHGEYQMKRLPNGWYGYVDDHGNSHVFTSGSPFEAKIVDSDGRYRWVASCMEHDGNDYFLRQHGSVPLDGLTVRERW